MLCVAVSFFSLPLYSPPAAVGGGTVTGWEFAVEVVNNMVAQGNTLGFILPIVTVQDGVALPGRLAA
jgi:hypothetical protein